MLELLDLTHSGTTIAASIGLLAAIAGTRGRQLQWGHSALTAADDSTASIRVMNRGPAPYAPRPAIRDVLVASPAPAHRPPQVEAEAPKIDAVIVPRRDTITPLDNAIRTASAAGAPLVVLDSPDGMAATSADSVELRAALTSGTAVRLTLPEAWNPAATLSTSNHGSSDRHRDTPAKRNAGMLLAKAAGWRHVLFMDDDIDLLGSDHLDATRQALAGRGSATPPQIAAWAFVDAHDRSVVGHACATAGMPTVSLIGAGAMAIDCRSAVSFFPALYNEDLLFAVTSATLGGVGITPVGTSLRQRARRVGTFTSPSLAVRQEFGELLATGLMEADLGSEGLHIQTQVGFWRHVVSERSALLVQLAVRLRAGRHAAAARCVAEAAACHTPELPARLAGYTTQLIRDHETWQTMLERPVQTLGKHAEPWLKALETNVPG
ncbi:hypothetical protein [Dactylosporangium sp. NPDC050588]|uniref:hypothetical protein n=1 Tax=Dactylosporangium sp. NPDC050588 TaxID=3157211 RepID=UPI0033CAE220